MASFTKRPNGSYQGVLYVGRDDNGTQIRRTVTKPTLKECRAAIRDIERELEDQNYSNIGNVRLVAWIEEWIELNKNRLSPSTHATYKIYLRVHYKPFFKNIKLKDLTDINIRKFMAHQLETLSSTTVRKHISTLNGMLKDALKGKNPAKYVKLPTNKKYTPYVPTHEEFEMIYNVVKGTTDEIIVLLAAWGGLRRGEIFALKPNDIFKNKGTIKVDESYAINDESRYVDKAPKSDNGYREIAIPDYLMDLLQGYMKDKGEIPGRLFSLRPDYYSERFHKIIVENKLPPIRFHDLRHYHATWLYQQKFPDHYAAKRMGHDIQTLKNIYQHLGLNESKQLDKDVVRSIEKEQTKSKKYKIKRTMQKSTVK